MKSLNSVAKAAGAWVVARWTSLRAWFSGLSKTRRLALAAILSLLLIVVGSLAIRHRRQTVSEKVVEKVSAKLEVGAWVVYIQDAINRLDGLTKDEEVLAAALGAHGFTFVVVKAIDDKGGLLAKNREFLDPFVDACHRHHLKVWAYGRFHAEHFEAQTETAMELTARPSELGLSRHFDGLTLDIEDHGLEGARLAKLADDVSKAAPKGFGLTVSTYAKRSKHLEVPYGALAGRVAAAWPQAYFLQFGEPVEVTLGGTKIEWGNWNQWPTATVYRDKAGKEPADPNDIGRFMTEARQLGFGGVSFFRLELAGEEHLAVIAKAQGIDLVAPQLRFQLVHPKPAVKVTAPAERPVAKLVKPVVVATLPSMPLAPTGKGKLDGVTVVLDPGHGGPDPGTQWTERFEFIKKTQIFYEASITYRASWELADRLRADGARVYLTNWSAEMTVLPEKAQDGLSLPRNAVVACGPREGQKVRSSPHGLTDRTDVVKWVKAHNPKTTILFVSLHVDSMGDKTGWKGGHVCYQPGQLCSLAKTICARLESTGHGRTENGKAAHPLDERKLAVLRFNPLTEKALVEMAMPRDPGDSWLLRSPRNRGAFLGLVLAGIEDHVVATKAKNKPKKK